MSAVYQLGTTSPDDDRMRVRRAMSHVQTACGAGTFELGEPEQSMGWTFFTLSISDELCAAIMSRFDGMIRRYRGKDDERLAKFVSDYLAARGCAVSMRSRG